MNLCLPIHFYHLTHDYSNMGGFYERGCYNNALTTKDMYKSKIVHLPGNVNYISPAYLPCINQTIAYIKERYITDEYKYVIVFGKMYKMLK